MEAHNEQKKDTHPVRPTIGLFVENTVDMGQGYYTDILAGVNHAAQQHDVNLLCFVGGAFYGQPGTEFDEQRNIIYEIASVNNLDGLISISSIANFISGEQKAEVYTRYAPLPVVTIGAPIPGARHVVADQKKGLHEALVHLIEVHGHRRIAFIRGPESSLDAEIRYQVYQDVLAEYDIPLDPDIVAPGIFRTASGAEAIKILLDGRSTTFDAVVAANDHMALGALAELQTRGMTVPYDVALVGFDDIRQTRGAVPPLSTVRQPLFRMGEEAVCTLLAEMAGESVAEEVVVPTELVVRRSCGCLQPTGITSASRPVSPVDGSVLDLLHMHRAAIVADLAQTVDFSLINSEEMGNQLLDSFAAELENDAKGLFLATLDRCLRVVIENEGDIISWQEMASVLWPYLLPGLGHDALSFRAMALLREAQRLIASELRHVALKQSLQIRRQSWTLNDIGQLLITMFDLEGLFRIIAENVPRLGIPSCYLVLFEAPPAYCYPQPPAEWSRLMLAYDENGRIPLPAEGQRFLTQSLLPAGTLPADRRCTMMIEALHFRDEQIGYVLLEKGPEEGNVYELLRGQIASALKGAFILQAQKQAEDELREHRDHLDDLVRERTAELAASNAQLRQEVTVRRQAEVKLEGYTAELERSNRELQAFAYVASHDLQEPLRKIQTFGDRLQQKYGPILDERGLNYLDRMQNAAARMQALIIDLLSFSRVRTHTEPFQQVDLQQVVTHVLQDLEIFVADVKAEIEVAKLPVLEADPSQMRQLFQNLIGNALKFHRQDIAPRIKIHCQTAGPDCEIVVTDNGIGFDERYADRIFNVFERLNGRDEYAGTGVGLAICRRIVERHNGTIYAKSKPGEGSRFIVRLPLQQAATETSDKEGAAQ